jgi:hypothetical protein
MPLADVGSLILNHVVFLTHLVYVCIFFTQAEPAFLLPLYVLLKLFAARPDDIDSPPPAWPPPIPKWNEM